MATQTKNKVGYVDGFVLVVSKKNVDKYRKMAREGEKVWMEGGALGHKECILDDANPDSMKGVPFLPFKKLTNLKPTETVWFSYIEFKNKKHRDSINKKVMKGMEEAQKKNPQYMKDMPFDLKKMSYAGFKVEVQN